MRFDRLTALLRLACGLAVVAGLASCGGGGDAPDGRAPGDAGTAAAASGGGETSETLALGEWEAQIAEEQGIAAARPLFVKEVEHLRAYADKQSADVTLDRPMPTSSMLRDIESVVRWWALSEARAIRSGEAPADFERRIWSPIFEAGTRASRELAELDDRWVAARQELVTTKDPQTGEPTVDPQKLAKYEKVLRELRPSLLSGRNQLFLDLAGLAKVAGRPDLVKKVFQTFREQRRGFEDEKAFALYRPDATTSEEFAAYLNDRRNLNMTLEEQYYGPPPGQPQPQPKPAPPAEPAVAEVPVTEEEKKAIREFIEALTRSMRSGWGPDTASYFLTPEMAAKAMAGHAAQAKTEKLAVWTDFDFSKARYDYSRTTAGGPVQVVVAGGTGTMIVDGRPKTVPFSNSLSVVFVDGQPKLTTEGDRAR